MTDEQAIEFRKKTLLEYMKMKMNEQDWHGVADSAMDMRELETELKMILHFKQQIQIQQQEQQPKSVTTIGSGIISQGGISGNPWPQK